MLFGATTLVLLIILSIALTDDHQPTKVLSIVSTIFLLLSQATVIYLVWWQRYRQRGVVDHLAQNRWRARGLGIILPCVIISVLAGGLSLATLIWTSVRLNQISNILGRRPWIILLCLFIVLFISIIAQVILFGSVLHQKRLRRENNDLTPEREVNSSDSQEMNETSRPGTAKTDQSHPYHEVHDFSSQPSTPKNSQPSTSLRSSLTITVHPSASKTKLLARQQSFARDSRPSTSTSCPTERLSQDSGFDTWDTSAVAPQIRESIHRSSPTTRGPTILAPIPGSRSPSPAKALEGPFFFPVPPESLSLYPPTSPLPNYSRPGTRRRSASTDSHTFRQYSADFAEEHIHPLFRTSSPTPPPSATPGTTVTAAPGSFEGLHINQRVLHRMRSGSLPSSPSPLGLSSPNYFYDALETVEPEPMVETERELTPPIPDFILSAGSRTSFIGYGRRKSENKERDDSGG